MYADTLELAAGAHFNTAAALTRLGLAVAFVAVVGDDRWGRVIRRELQAERMSDEFVRTSRAAPTPVSVALNFTGDRGFVTYGPAHARAEEEFVALTLEVLAARPVRHVHADLSAAPQLLDAARAAGASLSVDAHDAGQWLRSDEVARVVAAVDVVFANEQEALGITGAADAATAVRELGRRSRHVVVKHGASGATACVDGEEFETATAPVAAVDATGAGDCFAAGYLWGFLRGHEPRTCLALASLCGRAAVGAAGGYRGAPTTAELLAAAEDAGLHVT